MSAKKRKVNTSLRFFHEVLGFDHLHFGLWDGEPLTVQGLKAAQERYVRYLCSWIPAGVKSILDVGCGTGATALILKDRGYAVEGLSPDPYQEKVFRARTGLRFHLARFQEFEPEKPYDLVLMGESCQYVWFDGLFPAVRRTSPEGFLLVCDFFKTAKIHGPLAKGGHDLDAFLTEAERSGLQLTKKEDITERTVVTLDLAQLLLDKYVTPSLGIAAYSFGYSHPHLYRLGRWLLSRPIRKKYARVGEMVDSAEFRRVKRYMIMLFKTASAFLPKQPPA